MLSAKNSPELPDNERGNTQPPSSGQAAEGTEFGQPQPQPHNLPHNLSERPVNPLRSLGDALKEVQKRFDEILNGERTAPQEQPPETEESSRVEYLQPDAIDHNIQALGPAGDEQIANLDELKLIDDDDDAPNVMPMDVDPPFAAEEKHTLPQVPPLSESTEQAGLAEVEGAVRHEPSATDRATAVNELTLPKAQSEAEELTEKAETQLKQWQAADYPEEGAENIWRLYESLTHDLAYALCEQLRLILEPTLATRLKGDYRTGKRLNMKKIISYIASDYTKDKIWLRRTRPSQREYQILIALDDSRSMAESHSVHLAYQTLALVSKALSRLESGDIAIAKFGEHVDMLHGFDEGPFTDQAGTKVMNAFKFNQKATNVLSLVETSLSALETARERRSVSSSSAADLWQLEIIISDARCQDHDQLRAALRKAEEQRVMIVFIIIDSLQAGPSGSSTSGPQSILTMSTAEYKNVNGRMELQLRKYLDLFPFEYYVVLRNVESLPEVLSSTLKQFFERISGE